MCREKPENCLVTEFLTAQLTDFGTSRAKVREEEEEESVLMTGVGTPLFAAPEVMMGEYYDESIDVYSFAIVLLVITMDDDPASWVLEPSWACKVNPAYGYNLKVDAIWLPANMFASSLQKRTLWMTVVSSNRC